MFQEQPDKPRWRLAKTHKREIVANACSNDGSRKVRADRSCRLCSPQLSAQTKALQSQSRKSVVFLVLALLLAISTAVRAEKLERIHIIIPGGAGGGWDTTARGVGEALTRSALLRRVSYENISGGGGSKAISHLIETAERQKSTLLISSTPVIVSSLQNLFPQSYKDLTPVAAVIADYGAFVVPIDSEYQEWGQVLADFAEDPRNVLVAGGSVVGGMDHIVVAMAFDESGFDAREVRYIPYNAGAQAMVGLLSKETQLLSTGLSEALALAAQGEVRILASTAENRVTQAPGVPTLKEQGVDMVFENWRGFFAAPNLPETRLRAFQQILEGMYDTADWKEIRDSRGWSQLYLAGEDFEEFLSHQENRMAILMDQLGLR